MGRRMRGLEATALVDGYVHHNCAGLHQFQHVFGNQMRGFGSRNQNCADHYVHCGQQLADVVVGRVECVYVGRGLDIQLTQARQRDICNSYIGAQTSCHQRCGFADHSAAQHQHFGRRNARNTTNQFALAALGFLQVMRPV